MRPEHLYGHSQGRVSCCSVPPARSRAVPPPVRCRLCHPAVDRRLPLALLIGRHAGDIFEVDLPSSHWLGPLQGLMDGLASLRDALIGFEHTVDGLARGDWQLEE